MPLLLALKRPLLLLVVFFLLVLPDLVAPPDHVRVLVLAFNASALLTFYLTPYFLHPSKFSEFVSNLREESGFSKKIVHPKLCHSLLQNRQKCPALCLEKLRYNLFNLLSVIICSFPLWNKFRHNNMHFR